MKSEELFIGKSNSSKHLIHGIPSTLLFYHCRPEFAILVVFLGLFWRHCDVDVMLAQSGFPLYPSLRDVTLYAFSQSVIHCTMTLSSSVRLTYVMQ